jgi:hypothetical protein
MLHHAAQNAGVALVGDNGAHRIAFIDQAPTETGTGKVPGDEQDAHDADGCFRCGVRFFRAVIAQKKEGANSKFVPPLKGYDAPYRKQQTRSRAQWARSSQVPLPILRKVVIFRGNDDCDKRKSMISKTSPFLKYLSPLISLWKAGMQTPPSQLWWSGLMTAGWN